MAAAKQCDRCGQFYKVGDYGVSKCGSFVTGIAFKRQASESYVCYLDLCRECIDELKRFIDGVNLDEDRKNLYLD